MVILLSGIADNAHCVDRLGLGAADRPGHVKGTNNMVDHAESEKMREPYIGGGIWIRIQHRFGPRMTEWFLAGHTTLWGFIVAYTDDILSQPSWAGFRMLFHDPAGLGWVMMMLGVLRVGGLIVNGARKNVTPVIRQFSAGVGFFLWSGITYGYASSGVLSTWLAIYPLFALGELVNINRAAHDQGEARNGKYR
ncbi:MULTISPECIES: hypothetical protein [unclassified Rhizobium]